ncbi:uncharacterized protein HKW66_Vig0119540 [Vigna angularis]|uniref:Uncharacterized protein n=1 Tax=Phaseolus angularis TaxID=3914 RepID=A0A8T0JW35_PHAAN|nr:uncharacterized protein HKW66_Vig0119540 [Vigna angularis]
MTGGGQPPSSMRCGRISLATERHELRRKDLAGYRTDDHWSGDAAVERTILAGLGVLNFERGKCKNGD